MTFDQIVDKVLNRLNLSSVDATNRVGEYVNDRYREVTSSIGVDAVRLQSTDVTIVAAQAGLPDVVAADYDKINRIMFMDASVTPTSMRVLSELTYDELTSRPSGSGAPRAWAVKTTGAHSVTYTLDAYSTTENITLRLNGYTRQTDISSTTEPVFPEDFHDILIHGAMADELRKMEKPQLAQMADVKFQARLSDLRMFIAKSAYKDIVQGKFTNSVNWYNRSQWRW